jgi:hypothetical protein
MTHKPAVGRGGFGREKLIDHGPYIASAAPSSSPKTSSPPPPARLRRLAAALHSLGPRPLYEYLAEVADGADPWERLERYADLAPLASFIVVHDGDQLLPLRIIGGRR